MQKVKKWLGDITDLGLLVIALGIVAGILFGPNTPFLGDILNNVIGLVNQLGQNAFVGIIAIAILLWIFGKRRL